MVIAAKSSTRVRRFGASDYELMAWKLLAATDEITIWEWMCEYGIIPGTESNTPSSWLPGEALYMKKPLDVAYARLTGRPLHDDPYAHLAAEIDVIGASQIKKTKSFLHAILSWKLDIAPGNLAFITHRQKNVRKAQKVRILPMLEQSPRLKHLVPESASLRRERLAGTLWQLGPNSLHFLVANVAAELREFALELGIADEIEAYDEDVDGEGDPIQLFLDRQKRYPHTSLFAAASTPNDIKGHAWRRLCAGSHERLLVECLGCEAGQELDPDQLVATEASVQGTPPLPEDIEQHDLARWVCAKCGMHHTSDEKRVMVEAACRRNRWAGGTWVQDEQFPLGRWIAQATFHPDTRRILEIPFVRSRKRSFHINYLYARDCTLGRFLAHEHTARAGSAKELHTHITGWRADPIITVGLALSTASILDATGERYVFGTCPKPAPFLLTLCDQQGNTPSKVWFPYAVRAIMPGGESWLVHSGQVKGFDGLRGLEEQVFAIGGNIRRCDMIFVDGANGNLARELRSWAADQPALRVLLVGSDRLADDIPWREQVPSRRQRVHHPPGVRIFQWHSQFWRERVAKRTKADPYYPAWHLPSDIEQQAAWHLKSLTSEQPVLEKVRTAGGAREVRAVWRPRSVIHPTGTVTVRRDTHWWVCEVLADVAADLIGANKPPKPPADVDDSLPVDPSAYVDEIATAAPRRERTW